MGGVMQEKPAGVFVNSSAEFFLKEYEFTRREIEIVEENQRILERNAVVAVAVAWGWLWSTKDAPSWAYAVPFILSGLCWVRTQGVQKNFTLFRSYLQTIEDSFWVPGAPIGWNHRLDELDPETGEQTKTTFTKGAKAFWILLNAATLSVALLRLCGLLQRSVPWKVL
jgi:hypothetical protein